jgi:hypothetical protein
MSITEEERTNALGLFNSAECYREAADILASEHAKALSFDHPIRYHFYHAIELYLKAFLRTDLPLWPAPGSEDTELGVLMEPEVDHGETEVYAGVQA